MTSECPRCKASNPADKRFCGDCGAALDPALSTLKDLMASKWREQIDEVLRQHYKDQKFIEMETASAVVAKLTEWAKTFAYLVGIPVAATLFVLTFLGIRSYSDFSDTVKKAKTELGAQILESKKDAGKLKVEGQELAAEYKALRDQLGPTKALAEEVKNLSKRVETIERVGFTKTSNVSVELRRRLELAFQKFQLYLRGLGYPAAGDNIFIDVKERMEELGSIAYYDADRKAMVIDAKYVSDLDNLYREYMHHVLYSKGLPSDIELQYSTIESALATYFPCSYTGKAKFGEKSAAIGGKEFKIWDLSKLREFKKLPNDMLALIEGVEVWGGAFWEIRNEMGAQGLDKLLFQAWVALKPEDVRGDKGVSFVRKLLELEQASTGGRYQRQISIAFSRRGMTL
jgi:hypothetical protein